jgi:two-component system LytT family response regulator
MPQALLIDDELSARADLRAKLAAHPEVSVVGEAATVDRARALLASAAYDLVFLDIQLIGGIGFELVPDVRPGARIVFVTAYDRFALRAIEVNALDYLLKPVKPERLAESLRRLPAPAAPAQDPDTDLPAGPALKLDDIVHLRSGQRARFAPVGDITVISAADNYSEVRLADGTKVFLRKSLKAWEDTLPPTHFMRVHRTQIVNLARVTRYERDGEEHTRLFVESLPEPVVASRYRWSELRDRLHAFRPAL